MFLDINLRQKLMKLLPFSRSESSVHGGADVDDPAILVELVPDQLGLDHVNQEHLYVLHLLLNYFSRKT